ncbi:MAG: glycosyltransferase [Caulobacterales bacterium]
MGAPLVTVVVTAREGHANTLASLESVLADDAIPFDLVYVDLLSPPPLAAAIATRCARRGGQIIRLDEWMAPAAARKLALPLVKTKYVAFIDNDVTVERGCLEKLVACAEETGAGLVSPLYLQAGGGHPPTIHMAGGIFTWSEDAAGRLLAETHRMHGAPVEAANGLARTKVDYTEYHYVLGRADLLTLPGAISDDVLLVHEHIDLALFAREQGLDIFLEPSARATYIAFDSRTLADADFYRRRWDVEACNMSLDAFLRGHPKADPAGMTGSMRSYAPGRLQEFEIRRPGTAGEDLAAPMSPSELAQTRYALRQQAFERGYQEDEVRAIEQACDFATLTFDGLYRPDGRPFLNHVIGTASALVRYELRLDIVMAGLTHAAYTHRPAWMTEEEISNTLGAGRQVDLLVRSHPGAKTFLNNNDCDPLQFNVNQAEVMCLLAANEADMRLSGEYRATGRPAELQLNALAMISAALSHFGIDGLAKTASRPLGDVQVWPLLGAGARKVSFRLDAPNRRLNPI